MKHVSDVRKDSIKLFYAAPRLDRVEWKSSGEWVSEVGVGRDGGEARPALPLVAWCRCRATCSVMNKLR